jgi:hypothetical protein
MSSNEIFGQWMALAAVTPQIFGLTISTSEGLVGFLRYLAGRRRRKKGREAFRTDSINSPKSRPIRSQA